MKRKIALALLIALALVSLLAACAEKHEFGAWIDDKEPTCTQAGMKGHYHCTHCDKNFNVEKIEVNDDDLVCLLNFHARIFHERCTDAEPAAFIGLVGADGHLWIGGNLLGHILDVPGLDIKFALDDFGRAERTHLRGVAVHRSEEINACLVQEISDSLHIILVCRCVFSGVHGGFLPAGGLAAGCEYHCGYGNKNNSFHVEMSFYSYKYTENPPEEKITISFRMISPATPADSNVGCEYGEFC